MFLYNHGDAQAANCANLAHHSVGDISTAPAKRETIKDVICRELLEDKSNIDVLAAVKARFPDANTTIACVNWYRVHMRKAGYPVHTALELKRLDKARKLGLIV